MCPASLTLELFIQTAKFNEHTIYVSDFSTERDGVGVNLMARIQEVLGSNFGREVG
jgi:hypothetical protein